MFSYHHSAAKFISISAFLAFAIQASALDHHCVERHEICPDQYKKTTYSSTYQEMIKEKSPAASPIASPAVLLIVLDDDHDGINNDTDKCPQTPNGYKVDTSGCPKSVTLHINFPFASNDIPASSDNEIQTLTSFLQENPASMISIVGHTDNIGIDARNQPRSEARAKALADKLIANGIDSSRIKSSGKGSKEPVATNKTDEGRAQNRRIEVVIK